jgi:hypothetical protein
MKISIHLVNVHQNQMNQNENQVKHKYHAMNMIWEVAVLMVIETSFLKINDIILILFLDEWNYNHLLKYRNVNHNLF